MRNNPEIVVKTAKIINVLSAGLMVLTGLVLLLVPDLDDSLAKRVLLGVLLLLTGAGRLFGYFSNDLYRLAFQFDLAFGVFFEIVGLMFLVNPAWALPLIPGIMMVYVVMASLLRLQMCLDARRFGMKSWCLILLADLLFVVLCGLATYGYIKGLLSGTAAVGLGLVAEGGVIAFITAHTVRIRAKKKNLEEYYDIKK